jgi:hypothetical protein
MRRHPAALRFPTRLATLVGVLLSGACSGCPAATQGDRAGGGGGDARRSTAAGDEVPGAAVPAALRALAPDEEIEPFVRWSVPGVRLYCLSQAVPDQTTSRVVGIDAETGAVVAGTELLRRGGAAAPDELARRVFGALLGQAFYEPLGPGDERSSFVSEREWSLVQPARVEQGRLVFFSLQGDMAPELVEQRVDLATFAVTTRSAREVLLDRGETVVLSGPLCIPLATCGCWDGCARVEQVAVPGRDVAAVRFLDGPRAGQLLELRHECSDGRCFTVCAADLPDAICGDPYLSTDEECTESCPPSEAPFHCESTGAGCTRIAHPGRAAVDTSGPTH